MSEPEISKREKRRKVSPHGAPDRLWWIEAVLGILLGGGLFLLFIFVIGGDTKLTAMEEVQGWKLAFVVFFLVMLVLHYDRS